MKKAVILHAWFEKPENSWYPWLKRELEKKGYFAYLPFIPTFQTKLPSLPESLATVEKTLTLDENSVVVGHSIGTLLGMRLAEKYKFDKLFLVAGWDYDDLTEEHKLFWEKPIDHKKIKENVKEIYCITSDNDPYMTAFSVEAMNKRLGGKFILIKGAGHFTDKFAVKKIPEIVERL